MTISPHVDSAAVEAVDANVVGRSITTPPLQERYEQRVEDNQDLVIVVSDYHNRRGTGKTIVSLLFGDRFDRTDEGLTTDKVTLSAGELLDKYTGQPIGSSLVLDEAEAQVNKYNASSHVNQALRELVSMGRVEEKYLIMNMPASDQLDKDLLGLADVWVLITRKGQAIIHLLEGEPYNANILTPQSEIIQWSDIPVSDDLRHVYNELTRRKKARLRGEETDDNLVPEHEVQERIERAVKEAKQDKRDEIIRKLVDTNHPEKFGPSDVEFGFDLSPQRIGQIAREE